ncbi:thioredoxin family protein [Olivibacter jilunii]|uniref:thioredoxin family protein n=1 Tax=Olivibacter jilunii TaxID=985016 RepID=UPI00103227A7|nr:DUF255 domain-containing protein [Olivibacter jilunii]
MKAVLIFLLVIPILVQGQHQGIKFSNFDTWDQLLDSARITQKFIFIDCYATWCKPCHFMDDSILSQKEIGEFMNSKFINVKVQMNKLKTDPPYIKSWYLIAETIGSKYMVTGYPTYLILDHNGVLVYNAAGIYDTPEKFIAKISKTFNKHEVYFFLLNQLNGGSQDANLRKKLLEAAMDVHDMEMINKLKKEQIESF